MERIIIFDKHRKLIQDLKQDFFEAKIEKVANVFCYINFCIIAVISLFLYWTGAILCVCFNLQVLGYVIIVISIIYPILALKVSKVFELTSKITFKVGTYLQRYGKVVSKENWKYIKKHSKRKNYRKLRSKKSKGYCYYYSRVVALFLKDAQLMYCCIKCQDHYSGHAVVVKNNCVYDTNLRKHFDYDEYLDLLEVKIYKMFSAEEYRKESFFDDIRQGFKEWCAANNAYCNA